VRDDGEDVPHSSTSIDVYRLEDDVYIQLKNKPWIFLKNYPQML